LPGTYDKTIMARDRVAALVAEQFNSAAAPGKLFALSLRLWREKPTSGTRTDGSPGQMSSSIWRCSNDAQGGEVDLLGQ
jgi:hypothetical protein